MSTDSTPPRPGAVAPADLVWEDAPGEAAPPGAPPARGGGGALTAMGVAHWADPASRSLLAKALAALAFEMQESGLVLDARSLAGVARRVESGARDLWPRSAWMSPSKLAREEAGALARRTGEAALAALAAAGDRDSMPAGARARGEVLDALGACDPAALSAFYRACAPGRSRLPAEAAAELARTWDYVAACLGRRESMLRLSLALRSAALAPDSPAPEAWRAILARSAESWRRLALARAPGEGAPGAPKGVLAGFARRGFDLEGVEAAAADLGLALPPAESGQDPAGQGGAAGRAGRGSGESPPPALRVLDAIGDPGSDEGPAALRRFGRLLEPLPLLGGGADPDAVHARLRQEFPWMEEANLAVARAVAVARRLGIGHFRARPMLLVGPSGVGKTRYGRRVAEIVGLRPAYLSLSGSHSAMSVTGNERGWKGAAPCFPAHAILAAGSANPLVVLDEVDKAAQPGPGGGAVDALLPMLERSTARRYFDPFLLGNLDLEAVVWVLTANGLEGVPAPLLRRCRVIHAGRPGAEHFRGILEGVLDDAAEAWGVPRADLPSIESDLPGLERAFVQEGMCLRDLQGAVEDAIGARVWSPPGPRPLPPGGRAGRPPGG